MKHGIVAPLERKKSGHIISIQDHQDTGVEQKFRQVILNLFLPLLELELESKHSEDSGDDIVPVSSKLLEREGSRERSGSRRGTRLMDEVTRALSRTKSESDETTPLRPSSPLLLPASSAIQADKKAKSLSFITNGFSWTYALTIATCFGTGLYSGWLFWNTSKAGAEIIYDQLSVFGENFSWLISELTKYCCVETNSILNTQVMILMAKMIRSLLNRSEEEKYLTGGVNWKPWVAGGLTAIGAALPYASLDIQDADDEVSQMMAYVAAILAIPPYWFGGQSLLAIMLPQWFSKTVDDSISHVDKEEVLPLQKTRSILSEKMSGGVNVIIKNFFESKKLDHLIELQTWVKKLSSEKNRIKNLKHFIAFLIPVEKESKPLGIKSSVKCAKKMSHFLKVGAKSTASVTATVTSFALLISDAVTAYYAGGSLLRGQAGKIILGGLASGLTLIANAGFSWLSVQTILQRIWSNDLNVVKEMNKKTFYVVISILIIGGIFSGGTGAYEGYTQMGRFFKDIGQDHLAEWLPSVFEAVNYVGVGVVNTPYCLDWAQWLLGLYAERFGDESTKMVVRFLSVGMELTDIISNMKIINLRSLLKSEIFGNRDQLRTMNISNELVVKLFDMEKLKENEELSESVEDPEIPIAPAEESSWGRCCIA